MSSEPIGDLVEHLFRKRAGQIAAYLTRVFGPAHVDLAEEVVQEALLKALQQWPFHGVPDNPGGWLLSVARNAALDALRRRATFRDKAGELASELARPDHVVALDETALDRAFEDDELRMVLLCCHPSLSRDASVALALKTVGGFSVAEIARAFLAEEPAIAQRLVRAKRQLRARDVRFEIPSGPDLARRLDAALEVLYLMFNEGYAAHGGEALVRADVCAEALRLARLLASHASTAAPPVHALVALMAFQAARLPARVDDAGELVVLGEQDRRRWDRALIAVGFDHLARSAEGTALTSYHLQAAIAAVHARDALVGNGTGVDWSEILALYDQLLAIDPSPVVALNRAVALAKVEGPAAGLAAIETIAHDRALASYYLLPAVRGQLWAELGDRARAAACFRDALARPCSEPERRFLRRKLAGV